MKHRVKNKQRFKRDEASRKALKKSLLRSLIEREKIETTVSKAKFLQPEFERLVTIARKDSLHARRLLLQRVKDKKLVNKLLSDIGPRFKDRKGGYTRLLKTKVRKGDTAQMAELSLVALEEVEKEEKSKGKKGSVDREQKISKREEESNSSKKS